MRAERITPREWRIVGAFTLLLLVVTTLPYLAGWNAQGDDWRFSGLVFGAEDGYSYLAKMRLGTRGLWSFHLFYTPEPHAPMPLLFLPYLVAGQVVGLFVGSDDPVLPAALALAFHVMRLVFDALLMAVLYRFVAAFVRPVRARLLALALATVGGGLGWLLAMTGAGTAPEFYIPEAFSFLILFGIPHLALARAALLGGLLLFMRAHDGTHVARDVVLAAACWWLVGLLVPFYIGVVATISGAWGLALWTVRRRFPTRLAQLSLAAGGLLLPLVVTLAVSVSGNEAFAVWTAQNLLLAPAPLDYLLAYGVIGLPALFGVRVAWRRARHDARFGLLPGWVPAGLLLVYTPVGVQRRLGEGVLVPLAVLAALGVWTAVRSWTLRRRGRSTARWFLRLSLPLALVASLSTGLLLAGSFGAASAPMPPLFRPADEVAAFEWMNANAPTDSVVLAPFGSANALPAFANVRTFFGHGPETLDSRQKADDVERFFAGEMGAEERADLIARYRIAYVLATPERSDTRVWAGGLTEVFASGGYRVYATGVSSGGL